MLAQRPLGNSKLAVTRLQREIECAGWMRDDADAVESWIRSFDTIYYFLPVALGVWYCNLPVQRFRTVANTTRNGRYPVQLVWPEGSSLMRARESRPACLIAGAAKCACACRGF
jgi:hypothetical protein